MAGPNRVVIDLGGRDGVKVRHVVVLRSDEGGMPGLGFVVSTDESTSTLDTSSDVLSRRAKAYAGQVAIVWKEAK